MGFADPCHEHPLENASVPEEVEVVNCFHCELRIKNTGYNCSRCDYWIHISCTKLPIIATHPIHPQHQLKLTCDDTDTPCVGRRYTYHCRVCEFSLHLKSFFTNLHEKHDHCLSFSRTAQYCDCRLCGYPIYDSNFGCKECGFFIHHDCCLIPLTVKHHHVHELTIRHEFPEECSQVYCDICEDRDGKELDRTLSYYYCKKCDYIAHVRCATELKKDVFLVERYAHEHPLRLVRDPMEREEKPHTLGCNECGEVFPEGTLYFPSLIKLPLHPDHTLTWLPKVDDGLFKCTVCEFDIDYYEAMYFTHPLFCADRLHFGAGRTIFFGCDACGELGKGFRMSYGDYDLHLECFALPGKFEHESHARHPLYLLGEDDDYDDQVCNVCNEEIGSALWRYCCRECAYFAHLNCVASGLLSTLRLSIKNEPRFCNVIEPDKTLFESQMADIDSSESLDIISPCQNNVEDDETNCAAAIATTIIDLGVKEAGDVLCCPKCKKVVSTPPKNSSVEDWDEQHVNELKAIINGQTLLESDPLNLLNEKQIDEISCPICNILIFPPTYSCSLCQIYFHKSCANLPRNVTISELTFILIEPSFPEKYSSCSRCNYPITGYAYISLDGKNIFDVQCSLSAPLIKQVTDLHYFHCRRFPRKEILCIACGTCVDDDVPVFACTDPGCRSTIHTECAMLPNVIRHKIHKHPLELVYDLAELDDEYFCDACEKGLNPNLAAYRCVDTCKGYATSHVTCVITSKKKCHFRYDLECQDMTEDQKVAFRTTTEIGARKYGIPWHGFIYET